MTSESYNTNPFVSNDNSEARVIQQNHFYVPPYQTPPTINIAGGEYQHVTFPTPHIPGPYTPPNEQNNFPLYSVDTFDNNNKYNTISNPSVAYIPESNYDSYSSNAYAGGGLNIQSTNAYSTSGSQKYNSNNNNNNNDDDDDDSSDSSSDEDDNTENVTNVIAANPGIEASDPNKLNPFTPDMAKIHRKPNGIRFIFRFVIFLASIGAFMFMIGAPLSSNKPTPSGANKIAIIFTYIVSGISIVVSLFFLIIYCSRRWLKKNKIQRWLLLAIDLILGASFGCLMVFLIKGFSCKPGSENGWCDFYNTSIFFNVLCFVLYAISFFWDIIGSFDMFIKVKNLSLDRIDTFQFGC
ncbi:hypothetical protein Glove_402g53 [Diversispora epigaea]|uniref:MARVEL domain-containing protein n=1 Tax=Diversispora epigaea TaxID=1348612 RepID=A0A397GZA9_9GLOM|nr:hypothetical protein Glove_402g53 [Diversispora epigaea]